MKKLKIGSQYGRSKADLTIKDRVESPLEVTVGNLHDEAEQRLNVDNVGGSDNHPNPYLARIGLFVYLLLVLAGAWAVFTQRIGVRIFVSLAAAGALAAIIVSAVELRIQGKLSESNLMTIFTRALGNLFSSKRSR